MDLSEKWQRAVEETQILQAYPHLLAAENSTTLPYVFLAASEINPGDTVVRKGKVVVDRPLILLPKNNPQFSGFELEQEMETDEDHLSFFLMLRGIHFPSLKYHNEICTMDVFEGDVQKASDQFRFDFDKQDDHVTGLMIGPSCCWQFSVLLYVSTLINRSAASDLQRFLHDLRRRFMS